MKHWPACVVPYVLVLKLLCSPMTTGNCFGGLQLLVQVLDV